MVGSVGVANSRVIIVTDEFVASGGAAKVALQCLEVSIAAGLETAVLVGDNGQDVITRYPSLKAITLSQDPLRDSQRMGDVLGKTFNVPAYRGMKKLLEWGGPGVTVHVHSWAQILSPSIFHALSEFDANVVVTAHDFFLTCPNGGFVNYRTGEICELKPLSMSCLTCNCDKRSYAHKLWRFNRQTIQRFAGTKFWSRVGVILAHEKMAGYFDTSPLQRFLTLRTPSEPLTRSLGNPWENEKILFLGRMTWEKGVETLTESLCMLNKTATLIGRGPLLEKVRSRLSNCTVTGWIEDSEVAKLADEARYFVMPSRMPEPYGLVAAEAVMSGIPVIVSSNALISEDILQNNAGLVFNSGDPKSLAAAMSMMDNEALVKELSLGARKLSKSLTMSKSSWTDRMIEVYTGQATFCGRSSER